MAGQRHLIHLVFCQGGVKGKDYAAAIAGIRQSKRPDLATAKV